MLTGDTWYVQINGQVYGPYSTVQMHGFVQEGRIIPQSQISTSPGQVFRPASDYKAFNPALVKPQMPQALELTQELPDFEPVTRPGMQSKTPPVTTSHAPNIAADFAAARPRQIEKKVPTFKDQQAFKPIEFKAVEYSPHMHRQLGPSPDQQGHVNFAPIPLRKPMPLADIVEPNKLPVPAPQKPVQTIRPQRREPTGDDATIVLLVMAEFRSGHAMGFLKAIQKQGVAQRIGDTVWLLKTQTTANELRNLLSQTMQREDRLFIMDSFNNQTAWFNIGSDMDRRIREFWDMEEGASSS